MEPTFRFRKMLKFRGLYTLHINKLYQELPDFFKKQVSWNHLISVHGKTKYFIESILQEENMVITTKKDVHSWIICIFFD